MGCFCKIIEFERCSLQDFYIVYLQRVTQEKAPRVVEPKRGEEEVTHNGLRALHTARIVR